MEEIQGGHSRPPCPRLAARLVFAMVDLHISAGHSLLLLETDEEVIVKSVGPRRCISVARQWVYAVPARIDFHELIYNIGRYH